MKTPQGHSIKILVLREYQWLAKAALQSAEGHTKLHKAKCYSNIVHTKPRIIYKTCKILYQSRSEGNDSVLQNNI